MECGREPDWENESIYEHESGLDRLKAQVLVDSRELDYKMSNSQFARRSWDKQKPRYKASAAEDSPDP
jgi:hypothetical protein